MLKARLPGPGTLVVVYGDTLDVCREQARWREWRVVAEIAAQDDGAWRRALDELLEHRAHVLIVPGPQSLGDTPDGRTRRVRDVSLHYARLFYAETGRFEVPPPELTRAP